MMFSEILRLKYYQNLSPPLPSNSQLIMSRECSYYQVFVFQLTLNILLLLLLLLNNNPLLPFLLNILLLRVLIFISLFYVFFFRKKISRFHTYIFFSHATYMQTRKQKKIVSKFLCIFLPPINYLLLSRTSHTHMMCLSQSLMS